MITVVSKETAQSAIEDIASTMDETAVPTTSVSDINTEDPRELLRGDTDGEGGTSILNIESHLGFDVLLHERAEKDTSSTCGLSFRQDDQHPSKHSRMLVEDAHAFTKCLITELWSGEQGQLDHFCDGDCSVERRAEEAMVDEWEWDSG